MKSKFGLIEGVLLYNKQISLASEKEIYLLLDDQVKVKLEICERSLSMASLNRLVGKHVRILGWAFEGYFIPVEFSFTAKKISA